MNLRIKEVLEEKGISVVDLAEKLGVTRGACYNYINGNPTVEILNRIADAINVPVTYLFEQKNQKPQEEHNIEFYVSIDGEMIKISKDEILNFLKQTRKI